MTLTPKTRNILSVHSLTARRHMAMELARNMLASGATEKEYDKARHGLCQLLGYRLNDLDAWVRFHQHCVPACESLDPIACLQYGEELAVLFRIRHALESLTQ